MKKTYKVNHPIIKKITIRERFVRNDNLTGMFRFASKMPNGRLYFTIGSQVYDENLKKIGKNKLSSKPDKYDIKCKMLSLKDKLNLL